MKLLLFIIAITLLTLILYSRIVPNTPLAIPTSGVVSSGELQNEYPTKPPPLNAIEYTYQDATYSATWSIASTPANITLFLNNDNKTTSDVKASYGCTAASSAGFYDTDNQPLGLFISEGSLIRAFQTNALFNGIFSITHNRATITAEPIEGAKIALQSGPILYRNGNRVKLAIHNDEPTRRILIGITADHQVVLVAFYLSDNRYSGPLLQDLPYHLALFQDISHIHITDALNLDGGAASALVSPYISINELTHVGSFFCIKN